VIIAAFALDEEEEEKVEEFKRMRAGKPVMRIEWKSRYGR
jgi:hypothetical protein